MKIAITGNIGSGKSTFSNFAEDLGFTVLKADDISKDILANDEKVQQLITKEFGKTAYVNGKPNKTLLADEVFSNPDKLHKLEKILHPRVIKLVEKKSAELLKKSNVLFVEAALIYEADMEDLFDYVVLITASRDLRLERKIKSGFTESDFIKRELNQISEEEKKKRADFIFSNDSSINDLKMKFELLLITLGIN